MRPPPLDTKDPVEQPDTQVGPRLTPARRHTSVQGTQSKSTSDRQPIGGSQAKYDTVQLRNRAVQYDGAAEWLGQARVGSSSVGFGIGGVADQGFPSGCCRCGGRRSWADGATAAGVAGAGGDLFCDWDGAEFRGLLRGRVRATHRWSVVDDGMGAVVVSSDEIGYLSSTFTIGVRTAT